MNDIAQLNSDYGIAGHVIFEQGEGGMTMVQVSNSLAEARINLQGAHIMRWSPRGEQPVIWVSEDATFAPGKSIRGGVPLCWPWFGPHDTESSFPAHGFARTVPWAVIASEQLDDGRTRLQFQIEDTNQGRTQWPYPTELTLTVTVGRSLEIDLCTRNAGTEPMTVGQALHTYFEVSDVSQVQVQGLEGCDYLDKVDGFKRKQQVGAVTIDQEVDRIYLGSVADCLIDDPGLQRRIRISKQGSASTVVWNPWQATAEKMGDLGKGNMGYLNMLCVESANAAEDVVNIAPGEEHHLSVSYQVEALAES